MGFESAGTLVEEHPTQNTTCRAHCFRGGHYRQLLRLRHVLAAIGFGKDHVSALVGYSTPWFTLTNRYWGAEVSSILALTVIDGPFEPHRRRQRRDPGRFRAGTRVDPPVGARTTNAKRTPVMAATLTSCSRWCWRSVSAPPSDPFVPSRLRVHPGARHHPHLDHAQRLAHLLLSPAVSTGVLRSSTLLPNCRSV